jgi:hypothetical protein
VTQIHKEYSRYFLFEPTKLTRFIDKIHERLADHQHTTTHDYFTVFLTGNRSEELTNVDDVLALDNSHKHKIQRLLIVCSASTAGAARPEHEVQVDFPNLQSPTLTADRSKKTAVAIGVRSDIAGWANRTLSEVEEQVERAWQYYVQPVLLLIGIAACSLAILMFLIAPPERRDDYRGMWLKGSDLERVDALVREQRIITDQELREVVTRQLRNVLENERPQQSTVKGGTRQLLFIGIPLTIVVACALFLLITCYPRAVFLWGDEVQRYANMLQRRKILWGAIGAILFVGLLSKFLYEGVVPWFPR